MIGIRCQPTTLFCCRARSFVKPYLNSNDWAELFAAVKRLKVEQQVSLGVAQLLLLFFPAVFLFLKNKKPEQ
jgi:hypothetical protein